MATRFTPNMCDTSHSEPLKHLEERIWTHTPEKEEENEEDDEEEAVSKRLKKSAYVDLLQKVTTVVREADAQNAPDIIEIVEKAGDILEHAIGWAYRVAEYDFLPSFGHVSGVPPIEDPVEVIRPYKPDLAAMERAYLRACGKSDLAALVPDTPKEPPPVPWAASQQPHAQSTRLSRFRGGARVCATDATPLAQTILQARCDITSEEIACPIAAALATDSSALSVIGMAGWKNREPHLTIYLLDDETEQRGPQRSAHEDHCGAQSAHDDQEDGVFSYKHYRRMFVKTGLSAVAWDVAADTTRKLTVVADSHRIKTFFWGKEGDVKFGDWAPFRGQNVHTLKSGSHEGPLAVLPGGRIARAGTGSIAVWNVAELPTHQDGGRIGKGELDIEETWLDDPDSIETSVGSKPTIKIKFAKEDASFIPATWHLHERTGHMLVGETPMKYGTGAYGCFALDLENDAKKVTRFLGHGGFVEQFSTSVGDANVFATAGSDGYARLYDARHPLPVVTLNPGQTRESCEAVHFMHPDGLPVVLTGGGRSENIRVWDIRAQAMVYELAIGNNTVRTMAWDAKRNALYTATTCGYMDRLGSSQGYRSARIPNWARMEPRDNNEDEHEMDSEDEDDLYSGDCRHYWPRNAHHNESYFGYAYDAGDHVLLRHGFGDDAGRKELPKYGGAAPSSGWW